ERETATLVLTRKTVSTSEILLEGTGTASSSLESTFEERSPYYRDTRYDQGAGTSQTHVYVTIDPERGYYDVYITTGEFGIVYGGTRTVGDESHTYGPADATYRVQPAPILATGELTRK